VSLLILKSSLVLASHEILPLPTFTVGNVVYVLSSANLYSAPVIGTQLLSKAATPLAQLLVVTDLIASPAVNDIYWFSITLILRLPDKL